MSMNMMNKLVGSTVLHKKPLEEGNLDDILASFFEPFEDYLRDNVSKVIKLYIVAEMIIGAKQGGLYSSAKNYIKHLKEVSGFSNQPEGLVELQEENFKEYTHKVKKQLLGLRGTDRKAMLFVTKRIVHRRPGIMPTFEAALTTIEYNEVKPYKA